MKSNPASFTIFTSRKNPLSATASPQPLSPSAATRRREPSSTPGGMRTEMFFVSRTRPAPLHDAQGSLITFPAPPHCGQVRCTVRKPPCVKRICPRPPQPLHVTGCVPGLAPLPLQVAQATTRGTSMEMSLPPTASSNSRVRS